jgi:hypothetical protein
LVFNRLHGLISQKIDILILLGTKLHAVVKHRTVFLEENWRNVIIALISIADSVYGNLPADSPVTSYLC